MLHISENIKAARKAIGKSQQEVADMVSIKRSTYAKYELNAIPDIPTLIQIAKALNVDWVSLVNETITGEPIKPGNPDLKAIKENTEAILRELQEMKKK